MLVQQGKGSGTPIELHHTPSPKAQPPSPTTHSSPTLPPVTTTSIPADRATIAKSSTLPYDSTPRVTSPAADEGSMQQTISKLTDLCTSLQRQHSELLAKFQAQEVEINRFKEIVKLLEDRDGVDAQRSGDDAPIKGRSLDEGEAAAERISDDSEEMATIPTSMDAATVLASGVVDVPTGSGSIPTASTHAAVEVPTGSDVVPTASPVYATATVRVQEQIDAQVARELEEQLERGDQRRSKQIARDANITRIHAEEELQIMINGLDRNNETVAKYLQEYHQFASELPIERRIELINDLVKYQDNYAKVKDFRGMTFEEVEAKFNSVWKQIEDIVPMGSKEEAERFKRKGISFKQESAKKQKISKEGEGSGTPSEPHHTPFPEVESSHPTTLSILLPSIPTAPIPPVTQPVTTPIIQYSRRERIAQSSALPTVADEPASPIRDVSEGEAFPTESSFIADQDRATIVKSFTLPHDSSPRVTSPAADEGKEEIVKLKDRVKVLEDKEGVAAKQSGDDTSIKGRSINEEEAAAERISNDSEEIARILTSMDAATVLAGGIDIPAGSGFILTASPPATVISTGSEVGPTASPIVTRRKRKEVMVESDTPKKKKLQEQIDA
nr:hypothetical protein [Tanacetum cinerariifolium]